MCGGDAAFLSNYFDHLLYIYHLYTYEQFLKINCRFILGFSLDVVLLSLCVFCRFVPVLFDVIVLNLVSSVLCQEIGWKERLHCGTARDSLNQKLIFYCKYSKAVEILEFCLAKW